MSFYSNKSEPYRQFPTIKTINNSKDSRIDRAYLRIYQTIKLHPAIIKLILIGKIITNIKKASADGRYNLKVSTFLTYNLTYKFKFFVYEKVRQRTFAFKWRKFKFKVKGYSKTSLCSCTRDQYKC